jgi:hypothetical protein
MDNASQQRALPEQSALGRALMGNAGYARFWKLIAGIFLFVGILLVLERVWTLGADIHARQTWPVADGEIVSAKQVDDQDLSRRSGSISGRTRYWIEYEVRFAVPAERCRTGMIYEGPSETMPCHGIIRTRSTQSTGEVFDWFSHGYRLNEPVKVLWNPEGTRSTDVKIAGESIWLRYNFGRLVLSIAWSLGFGTLYVFAQRQIAYFESRAKEGNEEEQRAVQVQPEDNNQLTDLDLS